MKKAGASRKRAKAKTSTALKDLEPTKVPSGGKYMEWKLKEVLISGVVTPK